MRKCLACLAVLAAVLVFAIPASAQEELGSDLPVRLLTARDARTSSSAARAAAAGDTTFVGFVPGKVSASNYWGISTGRFRPYSTDPADYGYWSFDNDAIHDNIGECHGDSLFGWWPERYLYTSTGGQTLSDDNRPWWAVDFGNQCNYVLPGSRRTYGVTGVWHRDNGSASGGGVTWAPLSGSFSLWCGLRRDGDLAFIDPVTKNAFNARTLYNNFRNGGTSGGGIGTNQKFPGYASQWDQMAYRDLDVGSASTITLRFRYRTNLSTGIGTGSSTRTGWFDKDPLPATPNGAAAGNFISSSAAGVNAPQDSFMVYVGAPVNDASCLYSDGHTAAVFDRQRRWFSEVLRANEGLYREVLGVAGDHAAAQVTTPVATIAPAWGDTVRVVFRSKTNRGFDDEAGSTAGNYSSGGAGAVVLDDVQVSLDGGAFTTIGDFESASAVDNDVAVSPLTAWKSTGKPPAVYAHVHNTGSLVYEDLCGPVGGPLRICNLSGNVVSDGDHDNSEASAGIGEGTANREWFEGIGSPTINLRNGGGTNAMGINASIATVTGDYYFLYDMYAGVFDVFSSGNLWYIAASAYPGKQSDGTLCWGDWRTAPFQLQEPDKRCFQDQEPLLQYSMLQWSAADAEGGSVYPDSIRVYIAKITGCFRFGITSGCAPTDGCYWDDFSIAFVDASPAPLSVNLGDWVNDTFTVNGLNRNGVAPGTANFDTTSALVKSGRNIAQTSGSTLRYAVPGDTSLVTAAGSNVRMDLVFRIDPGPGSYVTVGNRSTSLRRVPTATTAVDIGAPTGSNFWEEYLLDNGAKGTPGGHPAAGVNGGRRWSNLVWNSARCDSAESNLYTLSSRGIGLPVSGVFASMYSESDPKFTKLGIAKNRCFLTTATSTVTQANIVCNIALTNGWPTGAGYVAENGLPLGKTYEYTKILPDGLFTPGTHVEYFFRREDTPIGSGPYLIPDTSTVVPQVAEGSMDGHRWQEFSVLPDAWKKPAYGGLGMACLLYVDLDDRRGDERAWVSIADSLGATTAAKWGAHNGWHAAGNASPNDPASFVYDRNAQPGTTWDMFGVKNAEDVTSRVASIGVDLAPHASSFQIDDKWSFQGPSLGMLEAYYSVILMLTGDLNYEILGPYPDFGNNDVKMLQDFLLGGTPGAHRGLMISGSGFVTGAAGTTSNASLLGNFLYTSLRDPSYLLLTGNTGACLDLVTQAPITSNGDVYGVRNSCASPINVPDPGVRGVAASFYSPAGNATPPVVASVFHDVDAANGEYWQSLVDGWDIQSLAGRYCATSSGRLAYYHNALTNIFGKICSITGATCQCLDVPNDTDGSVFVDFMSLRNNPLVTGEAAVEFGLAKADRVEVRVFDVSGRRVRTLADRRFTAGRHTLTWDGADDQGRQVPRGVYFTQARYVDRGVTEARKLTVLR